MATEILYVIGSIIFSYLLGSISFAVIISKIVVKQDVRELGSGNAGSTNVVRSVGLIPGLITFALDFSKGLITAFIGSVTFEALGYATENALFSALTGALFCGLVCQIGHTYPLFYQFKGGKGVATSAGILLIADWRIFMLAVAAFVIPFVLTKIISLGSVISAACLPIFVLIMGIFTESEPVFIVIQTLLAVIIAGNVLIRHKDNIKRLIRHEEKPIKAKKQ